MSATAAWSLAGAGAGGGPWAFSGAACRSRPRPDPTSPPPISALTPALVRAAYSINAIQATGAGATIAIVDAFHDPNLVADLNAFDKAFTTTVGGSTSLYSAYGDASRFLTVVSQSGGKNDLPKADKLWASEIALDVEWAHAIAPGAKILLVEARSSALADLLAADARAVAMGADVVSNSWGSDEFAGEASYDTTFAAKGVTFVFSAGDGGRQSYPATSPRVVSVGGTTLSVAGGRWVGETAWSGGGGGVSTIEGKPVYQNNAVAGSSAPAPTSPITPTRAPGSPSTTRISPRAGCRPAAPARVPRSGRRRRAGRRHEDLRRPAGPRRPQPDPAGALQVGPRRVGRDAVPRHHLRRQQGRRRRPRLRRRHRAGHPEARDLIYAALVSA